MSWIPNLSLVGVVLNASFVFAFPVPREHQPPLQVSILAAKTTFQDGEYIAFKVRLTNRGRDPIVIVKPILLSGQRGFRPIQYRWEVVKVGTLVAPIEPVVINARIDPLSASDFLTIPPAKFIEVTPEPVSDLIRFREHGEHRIQIAYCCDRKRLINGGVFDRVDPNAENLVSQTESMEVWSEPITIQYVVPEPLRTIRSRLAKLERTEHELMSSISGKPFEELEKELRRLHPQLEQIKTELDSAKEEEAKIRKELRRLAESQRKRPRRKRRSRNVAVAPPF